MVDKNKVRYKLLDSNEWIETETTRLTNLQDNIVEIEAGDNVEHLNFSLNLVREFKSSKSLKRLYCGKNFMEKIELNEGLVTAICWENNIEHIKSFVGLKDLRCNYNILKELELNEDLEILWCYGNLLNELNLPKSLSVCYSFSNNIKEMDINPNLWKLECDNLKFKGKSDAKNLGIRIICGDHSENTFITLNSHKTYQTTLCKLVDGDEWIEIDNRKLTNKNINKIKIDDDASEISCYNNEIDFIVCPSDLWYLSCFNNKIHQIITNSELRVLHCANNVLTSLSTPITMHTLGCVNNLIKILVVRDNFVNLESDNLKIRGKSNKKDLNINFKC